MPNRASLGRGILPKPAAPSRCVSAFEARFACPVLVSRGGSYNSGMSDPKEAKRAAAERGKKLGVPYAGALLPKEAHALMQAGAKLVDVRTRPELLYVGRVPGAAAVE